MSAIAGLIIGLTLVVIHIVGIPVTGVSVNPARSFGPAFWSGSGSAWLALPLFSIVPTLGGLAAGILNKTGILSTKDDDGAGERALNKMADRLKSIIGRAKDTAKDTASDAKEAAVEDVKPANTK